MSYQRKNLQILGGGFNLLPPGDKVPDTDYLLAQNWRGDRVGKLVSRAGYPLKFSIAGPAYAHTAAVYGGVEGDYYVAANAASGANPGAIYFRFAAAAIVSGLSGDRCGMIAMNGWMWIMDSKVQGKHNAASGYKTWGIAPPTNACVAADSGTPVAGGPSGTYKFYVTFATSDQSVESNPGPASAAVTVTSGNSIAITGIPVSTDAQVGIRYVYATGGTLPQALLVGTITDNTTTTLIWSTSDLSVTNGGSVMPTDHDLPPAGKGLVGPFFERLYTWTGNKLYYTPADQPQYWPGASDPQIGNWFPVGDDGEQIIWCTARNNVMLIYKERSIWRLIGDATDGQLERLVDGVGLVSPFALVATPRGDYFVAPTGLYFGTSDTIDDVTGPLGPLFTATATNTSSLTPPGSILPAPGYLVNSIYAYAITLGYALGKLYVAYREQSSTANASVLLVYNEAGKRWMYHRNGLGTIGFQGFLFDGVVMAGLTGDGTSVARAYNLDDFRGFYTQDEGATAIECVYQSHFEDAGLPDQDKCWLEVAVDHELAGDTATVYVAYDNGVTVLASVGTITGTSRQITTFTLPNDGVNAKNLSVAIKSSANGMVTLHNVHLYYYVEAKLTQLASTLATDLGVGKVKQCKELALDIDTTNGAAIVHLSSDLPGNGITLKQTISLDKRGRALLKYPFTTLEGYLWKLAVYGNGNTFRLYSARLLMRVMGTYVEAYEAAAGFVWDSMEQSIENQPHLPRGTEIALTKSPIKRFREIRLEIDTFNAAVTVSLLTDLPGNAQAVRFTGSVNTGSAGRRFVSLPLPSGTSVPIEGRFCRLQLSGSAKFVLYGAAVEVLPVGVYVEAYESAAGAVYDSREMDFGIPNVKEVRELELDIETTGAVALSVIADQTGTLAPANVTTSGRQQVMIPLTVNAASEQFTEGRLVRLLISGSSAYRLYGARFKVRPFGEYFTANESALGAFWDTTSIDLGTQSPKQLRQVELDIWAYGAFTVTVYTDQPGNSMASRVTSSQTATTVRTKIQIPLPQGTVPDNYVVGRIVRVTVTSPAAFKLFGARIDARPLGMYIESYEAAAGAVWDSTPLDLGSADDKYFDQVRFELDSDSAVSAAVYTDLPGEAFASRATASLTSGATPRHWATMPLGAGNYNSTWAVEGRSIRTVLSSAAGFRLYKAQVRAGRVGRYLAGGSDSLATLEFDFASERTKALKQVEVDLQAEGAVTVTVFTNQSGSAPGIMQLAFTGSVTTTGRQTFILPVTPGVRGKLIRVQLASSSAARIFRVRARLRPLNEEAQGTAWEWVDYPLEESDVLPKWMDLPVPATPASFSWAELPVKATPVEWEWAPLPMVPTESQWFWARLLAVEETPDTWTWVDVPIESQ